MRYIKANKYLPSKDARLDLVSPVVIKTRSCFFVRRERGEGGRGGGHDGLAGLRGMRRGGTGGGVLV